jgi:hypothetical protein
MVMIETGSPAPRGYTLVGSFELTPASNSASRRTLSVDVYRKTEH